MTLSIGSALIGSPFWGLLSLGDHLYFEPSYLLLSGNFVVFIITPLYYVVLTGTRGQTLGKMALGIKVVNRNGDVPGLGYAALREVVGKFISFIALLLGFLSIAWDPKKQGWHDKIAGTWVIKVE